MHPWPVLIAAIVVWATSVQAAPPSPPVERLLTAIRRVETGGRADGGRNAVGDGGKALGPYQIWQAYWLDSGVGGRYEDVRDPVVARRVVLAYWARYAPKALATGDLETLARLHNGGPGWSKRPWTTDRYWRRVQQAMR